MILYNVTVSVDNAVKDDWLTWMQEVHIPEVMATKIFHEYRMSLILADDESIVTTYAVQYMCNDMSEFENYQQNHAKRLQEDHRNRFKGRCNTFRTLLRIISHDKLGK